MWRRFGGAAYATLTLAVFTFQAVALVALTWAFIFDRLGLGPEGITLHEALALAVGATALAVMILTAYTLAYQAVSATHQRREQREIEQWRQRWVRVLFGGEPQPGGHLSGPAIEALVNVREKLTGREAELVDGMIAASGVTHDLIAVASAARRNSVTHRLDALDLIARAGSPHGFEALAQLTGDPELSIRVMSVRALARAAAGLDEPQAREGAALMLVDLIDQARIPAGAVEEALLVLGQAASPVLRRILRLVDRPELVAAGLDAVARLHVADLVDDVLVHLRSRDNDVRCAGWRAIAGIGLLPAPAIELLHAAAVDESPQVRSQAARACRLLPPADAVRRLTSLMTDASWWVRRASAYSLASMGELGIAALTSVAEDHHDRYAKHIALDVLVEMKGLDAQRALEMRAVG